MNPTRKITRAAEEAQSTTQALIARAKDATTAGEHAADVAKDAARAPFDPFIHKTTNRTAALEALHAARSALNDLEDLTELARHQFDDLAALIIDIT